MSATLVTEPAETPNTSGMTEEQLIRRAKRRDRLITFVSRMSGYILFLTIWQVYSQTRDDTDTLPGPIEVVQAAWDIWSNGLVLSSFGNTLIRLGIGVFLSFVVGSIIGILLQNKWFDGFFKDAVTIGLTTPSIVWVLVLVLIFGSNPTGAYLAILFTTFALVTVNLAEGVRSLPKDTIDMAKAFKVSLFDRNRHIVLPHLAPFLFNGFRFGFSIGWKVTLLTELFGASDGVGFQLRLARDLFRMDEVLAWILMFFFFALFVERVLLQQFERHVFRWRKDITTV